MNMRETRRRLRSLGRSLRPLEQEAEKLSKELEAELVREDDRTLEISLSPDPIENKQWYGPKEAKHYHEMDELQGIAVVAYEDIKNIREDIARLLRPAPKTAIP